MFLWRSYANFTQIHHNPQKLQLPICVKQYRSEGLKDDKLTDCTDSTDEQQKKRGF